MKLLVTTAAAIALTAGAAFAQAPSAGGQASPPQSPAPSSAAPGTGANRTMQGAATGSIASGMSQDFMRQAAAADRFEIESSRLAVRQARSAEVKSFAQMMIKEHTDASNKMKATARQSRMRAPAAQMTPDQQAKLAALKSARGEEFDRAYVAAQREAHAAAVTLFQTYAQSGEDPSLKAFAAQTLPVVQKHKQHVDGLNM
jgi:putative membrane protein